MQKLKSNILLIILVFLFMYTLPVYASETIKIALIDNYTKFESGDDFGWGLDTNYGAILAIENINLHSQKYNYEYKIFKSGPSPAETIVAVSDAIKEGYKIIVGLNWSTHLLMVAEELNKNNVLIVTPLASASVLPSKIKYFSSVMQDNARLAETLAKLVYRKMNISRVLVLKIYNDEYSLDLAKIFRQNYEGLGGRIIKELGVLQNQTNFSEIIDEIRSESYDYVVTLFHENEAAAFLTSAISKGFSPKFIAADGLGDAGVYFWPGIPRKYWHQVNGYALVPWKYEINTPNNVLFKNAFEIKHKRKPSLLAACAYDAVNILHKSILKGGTDIVKIHKALISLKDYYGITGKISYENSMFPNRDMYLIRIKDGKHSYVQKVE